MFTLDDLVRLDSVTQGGADLLRGIATARASFLVYARPRNAGKSTLTQAILAAASPDIPRRDFLGTEREVEALSAEPRRGYLVVAEIGHRGRPGYLAGEEVARVFRLVAQGWAVASSLHADSVDEVFAVLSQNGVEPAAAASVRYLAKVRALGDPDAADTKRVVEDVHEIGGIGQGQRPVSTLLYRWPGAASAP